MIEEPYRWVEAVTNRREYIEHQLAGGSPIVAVSFKDGILLLTMGRERQKLFEIYDRIAMGGIGHPGDIERLRMAAIELTSAEGFARSADDVSLRRLANYSLSPLLKSAFEQIYGAPYLARMIFAELGRGTSVDTFLRMDYDGSIHTNGGTFGRGFEHFSVLAGSAHAMEWMRRFLAAKNLGESSLAEVLELALDAWALGDLGGLGEDGGAPALPSAERIAQHRLEHMAKSAIEAAVLDRHAPLAMTWRTLPEADVRLSLGSR